MVIKKLDAGTRIYLTKPKQHPLYIQPDKVIENDNLYVAYDVRQDGQTVIPRGTRVVGNWITESKPILAAQLQLSQIYLQNLGQGIYADSNVIRTTTDYNKNEVGNACYLSKIAEYQSPANIKRSIVNANCKIKILSDKNPNSVYLKIDTREIPVTLTADFVAFPNTKNI